MNIPPVPKYEFELAKLEKTYKSAFQKIVKQLEKVDPTDLVSRELYESQLRQLTFIIHELTDESKDWFEKQLTVAFTHAEASALVTMGLADTLMEAKGKQEFSLMSRVRIEALIADTFTDVLKAHSVMEERMKQMVRNVQAEVLRESIAMQRGSVTSGKNLRSALLREGFSRTLLEDEWRGITDAGGRRWDLTTYTQMVAKTKLSQAQQEGARVQAMANGQDLAVISSHGAKDACKNFEGMIISLEGRTRGYRTLSELKGSSLIFHPNCQHSVHPIGDLDAFPQSLKDKASRAERTATDALENRDKILQEDNARRYREKKEKLEMTRQTRRNAQMKAREKRKIEKTSSSMVVPQSKAVGFDPDSTKLGRQFKKELYEGTPLISINDDRRDSKAVKAMFGDKMTLEGIGKAYNPDPSKYMTEFRFLKTRDIGQGNFMAELDLDLKDKSGNSIGRLNRTILKKADGSMVVQNTYFELEKAYQGAGFSRDIYFKTEQLYKEMAKGKPINITLTANLDVGSYAWSKHGFDFNDPEVVMELRKTVERDLTREIKRKYQAGEVSREDWFKNRSKLYQKELNSLGYNSLDEITHAWQFGALDNGTKHHIHTNGTQGHYGKKLLLDIGTWKGVKKLNQGHDSEVIGDLYFSTKGVK